MKILIILAHPREDSFNHAIAQIAIAALHKHKHSVLFHDLYKEKFEPLLSASEIFDATKAPASIKKRHRELANADGIIIIHPNWWGQPPAILKGWIDRVVRDGVAYTFKEGDSGEGVPVGLLKAKKVLIINTSDTPKDREEKVFGDPLARIWKKCIFDLCGVKNVERKIYRVVVNSTLEQRKRWLIDVENTVSQLFPRSS